MPGKGEVGKLHVKVIPDLSRFAEDLKKKLRRVKKQVGDLEVRLTAEVDVDRESLERARRKVESQNVRFKGRVDATVDQSELSRLKQRLEDVKAEVRVNAHLAEDARKEMQEKLDTIRSKIRLSAEEGDLRRLHEELNRVASDVQVDIKLSENSLKEFRSRLKGLAKNLRVDVELDEASRERLQEQLKHLGARIEADAHLSEESKKKLKHELDKLEGKATVNADLDDGKARFDLNRFLRPRELTINVKLGKAALARAAAQLKALAGGNIFENMGRDLNDLFKNLDTAAVKFAAVSTAVLGLTSVAGAGLGVVSALGVGIAHSLPALLAVPGIMGAAGAGIGIFVAAMKDASDVLADLQPAFEGLQQQISGSFWANAAQPIRDFANTAISELSPAVSLVAANLGSMTAAIANAASEHIPGFQQSLGYLAQALDAGGEGAGAFTNGLLTMGEVGAKYLPSIAAWANDLAYSFENWATKAAASGEMDAAIQRAAKAFGTLKDITIDLGGILGGLFTAMANGSAPLDSIATALDRANAAVNGPLFQSTLTEVFSAMGTAASHAFAGVGSLGDAFVSLAPTLSIILPLIGQIIETGFRGLSAALQDPAFQGGITSFFQSVLTAVQALAPAMPALGQAFGAIASVMGTLLAAVAPLIASLVQQLAPVFSQLAVLLAPIIEQLAAFLMPVIEALVPVIAQLAATLLPIVSDMMAQILPLLVPIIQQLADALIPAIQLIGVVMTTMVPQFVALWQMMADTVSAAIQVIKGVIQIALGIISGDWSTVWEGIKNVGQGVWNAIKATFGAFASAMWSLAKAAWNGLLSAISSGWNSITSATSAAWSLLTSYVRTGVSNAVAAFKNLPSNIKNLFSGAGSWLYNAGKQVIQGFINGLKSMYSSVKNSLGGLTNKLTSWKGPASTDRVILRGAGQLVIQGFIEGLESQYDDVRASLRGFTDDLSREVAPDMSATVKANYEKTTPVKENPTYGDEESELHTGGGASVTIVNNYPQKQSDSKTRDDVADGIRLASSI